MTRITFVCLGNICRSPMAEGIFKHLLDHAGLQSHFHVESAGVGPWHVGEPPDRRAQQTARAHGIQLSGRGQQIGGGDLARFDHVIAMDAQVAEQLRRLARTEQDRAKIVLMRAFDPQADGDPDVPDPYYGGPDGFEVVFGMLERSCRSLLEKLRPDSA